MHTFEGHNCEAIAFTAKEAIATGDIISHASMPTPTRTKLVGADLELNCVQKQSHVNDTLIRNIVSKVPH